MFARRHERQQVHHALSDGHPRSPSLGPVRGGEPKPDLDDASGWHLTGEQGVDRLGHDQGEAFLEALDEASLQTLDRIRCRPVRHPDLVAVDGDIERHRVVSPQVERAARNEIETGVVPMAGEQPVVHRAAVKREPHVRAPVFDRPRPLTVPEDHHRQLTHLAHELTHTVELRHRADESSLSMHGDTVRPKAKLRSRPPPAVRSTATIAAVSCSPAAYEW